MDIGYKGTASSWESDVSAPFISKRGLIIIWLFVGMKLFQSSSNVKTQRRYNITVYNIHKQNNRTHTLLFSSHAHASSHTPAFYHFTSPITRSSLPPSPVLCCLASCYFYETFLHSFCLRCTFLFVAHHCSWIGTNVWKSWGLQRSKHADLFWAKLQGTGWKQTHWGMSLLCTNLLKYPNDELQDISQHLSTACTKTLYRRACIRRQTHRVEEDISINYSLARSGKKTTIESEKLIEFR